MKAIDALRREFICLLKDTGLVDSNAASCNAWSSDVNLIRAVICYGLYPGIGSVVVCPIFKTHNILMTSSAYIFFVLIVYSSTTTE